jgi:hypothetical protein
MRRSIRKKLFCSAQKLHPTFQLTLGLKVVGYSLITSPKPTGRRAMQLGLLHTFGHAFGHPHAVTLVLSGYPQLQEALTE